MRILQWLQHLRFFSLWTKRGGNSSTHHGRWRWGSFFRFCDLVCLVVARKRQLFLCGEFFFSFDAQLILCRGSPRQRLVPWKTIFPRVCYKTNYDRATQHCLLNFLVRWWFFTLREAAFQDGDAGRIWMPQGRDAVWDKQISTTIYFNF